MARNDPLVNFRIPADLKDRLVQAASDNNRSITAELVMRLERSFALDMNINPSIKLSDSDQFLVAEAKKQAAEWGCSMTQALIRMTIEELKSKNK